MNRRKEAKFKEDQAKRDRQREREAKYRAEEALKKKEDLAQQAAILNYKRHKELEERKV